jgi:response regulator of citrate/malate metabolism
MNQMLPERTDTVTEEQATAALQKAEAVQHPTSTKARLVYVSQKTKRTYIVTGVRRGVVQVATYAGCVC